jgi:hypothetical protein
MEADKKDKSLSLIGKKLVFLHFFLNLVCNRLTAFILYDFIE